MKTLKQPDLNAYIGREIILFHDEKLVKFKDLEINDLLRRKNPYLFKTKYLNTAEEFVRALLDASLSSSEETRLGNFLERLAIFINEKEFGGKKSAVKGIDLEFKRKSVRYLVSIKSGPNWGNSGQIKKMQMDFQTAQKTVRTSGGKDHIQCIEGCCYGKDNADYGNYKKVCGQAFWEFVSGEPNLYKDLIEPLGMKAKEKNTEFKTLYNQTVNKFVRVFIERFVKNDRIDWETLIEFNSGKKNTVPKKII